MSEAIYDVSNATRMPSVCGSSCHETLQLYTSKLEKPQTSNFFFVSNPIEIQTSIPCICLFADLDCVYKNLNGMEARIDFSMLPLVWGIQWTDLFNELFYYIYSIYIVILILVNIIQLKVIAIFFNHKLTQKNTQLGTKSMQVIVPKSTETRVTQKNLPTPQQKCLNHKKMTRFILCCKTREMMFPTTHKSSQTCHCFYRKTAPQSLSERVAVKAEPWRRKWRIERRSGTENWPVKPSGLVPNKKHNNITVDSLS